MTEANAIVIIGGGHAGAQLCAGLAGAEQGSRVHLVCEEPQLPYQRPPLSKAYLKDPLSTVQPHRAETWFAENGITVHLGDPPVAIDRAQRSVRLQSGRLLAYAQLVLATGTRARGLQHLHLVRACPRTWPCCALRPTPCACAACSPRPTT